MSAQLIPPPELAPSIPRGLTPQQRLALWIDLVDACEQMVLAGLRRKVGPDGDVWAAYRQWNEEQEAEHERTLVHMMQEIRRREAEYARRISRSDS
jgi:hypothetical protein